MTCECEFPWTKVNQNSIFRFCHWIWGEGGAVNGWAYFNLCQTSNAQADNWMWTTRLYLITQWIVSHSWDERQALGPEALFSHKEPAASESFSLTFRTIFKQVQDSERTVWDNSQEKLLFPLSWLSLELDTTWNIFQWAWGVVRQWEKIELFSEVQNCFIIIYTARMYCSLKVCHKC